MDQLPALGTAISKIAQPTFGVYVPILLQNAAAIKSTAQKTFSYGQHDRQQLDVYYPSSSTDARAEDGPILVFIYGGGLVRGDKIISEIPQGVVHANVGHFFAEKYGYTVVIPDYRLISHGAKFPSGGEDIALVVEWMTSNLSGSKPRDLYMMGNSAGGIHLSTFIFAPDFASTRSKVLGQSQEDALCLRRIIELSVPFHFQKADESRKDVLKEYYGDNVSQNCPLGLLEKVLKNGGVSKALPGVRFLVLNGSLDPQDEILDPKESFLEAWSSGTEPAGNLLQVEMMEGHNHLSPPLSLGTGRKNEEVWGDQVATFCGSST